MALHARDPVPPKEMAVASPVHSICETQRIIYRAAEALPDSPERDEIMYRARLGVAQGKAMSDYIVRLTGDSSWFRGWWRRKDEG